MSTSYYQGDAHLLIGVKSWGKAGAETPRGVFTWAVNPAEYLWGSGFPLVVDEYGQYMSRSDFVEIVAKCEVQEYDRQNLP